MPSSAWGQGTVLGLTRTMLTMASTNSIHMDTRTYPVALHREGVSMRSVGAGPSKLTPLPARSMRSRACPSPARAHRSPRRMA